MLIVTKILSPKACFWLSGNTLFLRHRLAQCHCHGTHPSLKKYSLNSSLIDFASSEGLLAFVTDREYHDSVGRSFLQDPSLISPVVVSSVSTNSLGM